jgi:hypothetical protein
MANDMSNRREALKKIGMALAAVTAAGSLPVLAQDKTKPAVAARIAVAPGQFKIPENIQAAVKGTGDFDVFVARKGSDASAFVVHSSDAAKSSELAKSLKAAPAKASIVNGVIHVGLGSAGAARGSVANQGVIDFKGAALSRAALFTH